MSTYDELIMKIAAGEKLNPLELEEFRQKSRSMDAVFQAVSKTIKADGTFHFENISARSLSTEIPYNRAITYTDVTNSPIASGSYTDLALSGTRGYIKESDACVIRKPGTTDRFIRNPFVPQNMAILMLAEISWHAHSVANTYHDLYFDFYDNGGYDSSAGAIMASSLGRLTNLMYTHEPLLDNWEVAVNVYQDSGSPLALYSANVTFMLM